jgi:metal-responsive CopG/Arc/MetJ family transcriptional regulator
MAMRVHISLDDDLVQQLDQRVGARHRSAFIAQTIRRALEEERLWEDIEAGLGALAETAHAWDGDPAGWVTAQRTGDATRVG